MIAETLLLRQVHPSWLQNGRVTSQTFRPTPKDEKRLSVYDGDLIGAETAWSRFTGLGHRSVGVMAVTVGECRSFELRVDSDPATFPEHAVIDFTGLAENQIKTRSKQLKAAAEARGWQYLAPGARQGAPAW